MLKKKKKKTLIFSGKTIFLVCTISTEMLGFLKRKHTVKRQKLRSIEPDFDMCTDPGAMMEFITIINMFKAVVEKSGSL